MTNTDSAVTCVGLGAMGAGMAHRLRSAGRPLVVHNRTPARCEPLAAVGARVAPSVAEAVRGAHVVLLSLSDHHAVEEVLFERARLEPGTLVVDTSTVSPAYSVDATDRLASAGVRRIEACVVGNPAMAQEGALRVFTAGRPEDVGRAGGLLDLLAQEVRHVGDTGTAAALKLGFNMLLGTQVAVLAEAVTLAERAGVDRDLALSAIGGSGFSPPPLAFRAGLMRRRAYEPAAFRASLMEKDLRLAIAEAASYGVGLPVTTGAADRFTDAVLGGDGDKDAAVVAEPPAGPGPTGSAAPRAA